MISGMISADECRDAQGRVGNALRAMTDAEALNKSVNQGSPAFWAIALALDAVARRPGGFEVGSADAELWFDWDVIFAWLVEHAKGMTYVIEVTTASIPSGYSRRTFRLDPLGPKEEREKKARFLRALLVKAALAEYERRPSLGAPPTVEELPATVGLDPAVIAGDLPKVRDQPGGNGGGGPPGGGAAAAGRRRRRRPAGRRPRQTGRRRRAAPGGAAPPPGGDDDDDPPGDDGAPTGGAPSGGAQAWTARMKADAEARSASARDGLNSRRQAAAADAAAKKKRRSNARAGTDTGLPR